MADDPNKYLNKPECRYCGCVIEEHLSRHILDPPGGGLDYTEMLCPHCFKVDFVWT